MRIRAEEGVGYSSFTVPYKDICKTLPDIFAPVLQVTLEVGHKFSSIRPIHNAMIKAQREALNGADGDGVSSIRVRDHLRLLVQPAYAKDRGLRLVDDGGTKLLAKDAGVGDGEGSARDLVGS